MSFHPVPRASALVLVLGLVGCDDDATSSSSSGSTTGMGGATSASSSQSTTTGSGGAGGAGGAMATPGIVFLDYGLAIDVTPDGKTAVFEDISTLDAKVVFYDTIGNVATVKTSVGDATRDFATGVSGTGRVTALYADPVLAGYWSEAADWAHVETPYATGCDMDFAGAWDVSADGTVVVGMTWHGCFPEAFRWTDSGGKGTYQTLEVLGSGFPGSPNPPTNRATVVSDDGKVTAGFAQLGNVDRSPAIWAADGKGTLLTPELTDTPGEVLSIDATGATVAGLTGYDGFVWTGATGLTVMQRFDVALPSDKVFPNAITANGSHVFGGVGDAFFTIPIAFVWTAGDGMKVLADVATASGITLPAGALLNNVTAASADGTVLIGTAMDAQGTPKTFVLRLPAAL